MTKGKGALITFEGGDGCGKSTQIAMTAEWLQAQGREVLVTRQPGGTALGKEIRRLLLDGEYLPVAECELLMFLADRAQHVREVLLPALAEDKWVLCDRYSDSTLAYQLAARKLAADDGELRQIVRFAESGLTPQLTFWLDLPVDVAMHRVRGRAARGEGSSRLDEEALSFHEQVHSAFAQLWEDEPARIKRIDAALSIDEVQAQIRLLLAPLLGL